MKTNRNIADNFYSRYALEFIILFLITFELSSLVILYQIITKFNCYFYINPIICGGIGSILIRAIVLISALCIFFIANPASFTSLPRNVDPSRFWMLSAHFFGVFLLFIPLIFDLLMLANGLEEIYIIPWLLGALFAAGGILFFYISPFDLPAWIKKQDFALVAIVGLALLSPEFAVWGQSLWDLEGLSTLTFDLVFKTLFHLGGAPVAEPENYSIGLGDFIVNIGAPCSGIEGFILITIFIFFYGFLFKDQIRFPHYWLMVPLGIAASGIFNVLRISILIWIGATISPELAVKGFHSHAGWIAFTLLSLCVLWVTSSISWFRKPVEVQSEEGPPPFLHDWNAARLIPFVVFMLSGVIISATFTVPEIGYPFKAVAMFMALSIFGKLYFQKICWSLDPIAIIAGTFTGFLWLFLLPYGNSDSREFSQELIDLSTFHFTIWVFLRVTGTVFLVPVIEELLFRGYILAELNKRYKFSKFTAICVSTVLFAILHGRWLAAGIAGLVFALIYFRREKLMDAIIAHMAANTVVASWALFKQDWGAI